MVNIYCIKGIVFLIFFSGCNDPQQTNGTLKETPDSSLVRDSLKAVVPVKTSDTMYAGDRDTTFLLRDGESFLIGHISANKSRPKYTLAARKGQTVTAILRTVKKGGNVRINQIQQPGGAFDGPFGDSLAYTFKRTGNLLFIIGENLMAGDPYTGDFILHIKVSGL